MGKLNIQGDLDIHNYLSATNTNLYLSSASSDYSIRFRIGTTEVACISPSGCLNINSTQTSDTYKLYVNGKSYFAEAAFLKSTVWINNNSIGGRLAFLPTRSTDGNATGLIDYYACGSSSNTSYTLGSFYFIQYSYTSGTYNRVEYYDRYNLPAVAADKTVNNTYKILTSKNAVTVAEGGTGRTTLTSGYALVGNGTSAVSLREIATSATSGSTSLITSGGAYNIASQAITNITRSGTTFTATRVDGTTFTFTQRDNNTTYTFTNKAATLAWGTTSTIATVGGTDITVTMPANPNTNTYGRTTNTTSKIFLMGGTSQSASNKTTYSNVNCYASGGYLYSGSTKVSVEGHTHSYVPLSGGSMSGQLSISINSSGTSPSTQHIILNGQNGSTAVANAPGLAMHIGNQSWSTLKFLYDGSWRFYNASCSAYMPIYCSKTVVSNYGSTLPSSGATGEVFFKI